MLDGETHRLRKSLLMSVFTESAMENYIEPLRAIFHKHFLSVAFWSLSFCCVSWYLHFFEHSLIIVDEEFWIKTTLDRTVEIALLWFVWFCFPWALRFWHKTQTKAKTFPRSPHSIFLFTLSFSFSPLWVVSVFYHSLFCLFVVLHSSPRICCIAD